ncbi:MAG: response regulator [Spirochaetaceae bacterium]
MKIETLKSAIALIITAVIFILGIIFLSINISKNSNDVWLDRALVESSNLTNTMVGWLEENFAIMYGVGSFFEYSEYVSPNEFYGIAGRLDKRESANFLKQIVSIKRERSIDPWLTSLVSSNDGEWDMNSKVSDWVGIENVLDRSLQLKGSIILGSLSYDKSDPSKYYLSIAYNVPTEKEKLVILGFLDIATIVDSMNQLYVPKGLNLILKSRESIPGSRDVDISGRSNNEYIDTVDYRISLAHSELIFTWQILNSYNNGPDLTLSRVVLFGGIFLIILILIVFNILLKQNSSIAHKVEIATKDLIVARKDAEQANKSKSEFLANMSHEIRTPMNAIIGLSHLMQKTNLNSKQDDYINKIYSSSYSLLGIINDILDFSKIEAGKLEMELISFNLTDVFDNLGNMIAEKVKDKGLELVFNINRDVPKMLIGDPLRLGQILLNLTNNAIKFTDNGEISVIVELVQINNIYAELRFMVRDSGIGLSLEQSGKLFKAFTQADSTTTRKYGGTGLGLSISKTLSELMGGTIGVNSILGEGSTFYFSGKFEIREDQQRKIIPEELNKMNVLIIDDNPTSREVLIEYTKDFSLNPTAVDNGQEAIQLFENLQSNNRDQFDIVLIDYSMPGLNGFQTFEKIKSIVGPENCPKFILVTSYGRDEIISGIRKHNFSGFVLKPINQDLLLNTILQALDYESQDIKEIEISKYPVDFDNIRGANVLLVEDNIINQQVAKELLEAEGFYVDIADNGEISIQMVKSKDYDIVLMDLQMPVMGGAEATLEIRKLEEFDKLPIVAMTADAMSGVKETVLKVGMDDYITKPIDTNNLWVTLVKHIKPKKRELPLNYSKDKKNINDIDIPIIDGLDITTGLKRVGNNRKLYKKLIKSFVTDFKDISSKIQLLENNNVSEAIREAHTLKGVAGNLGADDVHKNIEIVEKKLKSGEDIKVSLSEVSRIMDTLIKRIISSNILMEETSTNESSITFTSDEIKNKIYSAIDSLSKRKPKPAIEIINTILTSNINSISLAGLKKSNALLLKYKMKDAIQELENILVDIS